MPKALPKPVVTLFFLIGFVSALCFRLIVIVQRVGPSYVRIFWYVAVITNIIFFMYRYLISLKRKHAVADYDLLPKIRNGRPLAPEDQQAIEFLLVSIARSRENLNYLSIFILSVAAIGVDIFLSLHH